MASSSSNKSNKVLIGVVLTLIVILAGVVVWQSFFNSSYVAIYLKSGDLYFGKLMQFPNFGLKNVYILQPTTNAQNPLSIQKFTNVFWGPEDFIQINKSEVVWTAKLAKESTLVNIFKTNPDLTTNPAAPQPGAINPNPPVGTAPQPETPAN